MDFELRIQDPMIPAENQLASVIASLCADSTVIRLRMFFGFLTGSGLQLLLRDSQVHHVLYNTEVDLIVGVDAVTDRPGLELLQAIASENSSFNARVLRGLPGSLVHPKLLIASYRNGGTTVVVGSNNLTSAGLVTNVEAFAIARFGSNDPLDLSGIDNFLHRWNQHLTPIDDDALAAADRNRRRYQHLHSTVTQTSEASAATAFADGHFYDVAAHAAKSDTTTQIDDELLIAQVPKAGNRWSQIHYTKGIVEGYFKLEAQPYESKEVICFRMFGSKDVEKRIVVYSRRNMNFKIELGEARRIASSRGYPDYPTEERPLLILRRETDTEHSYRYLLLMPGDDGHEEMTSFVKGEYAGPPGQVARVVSTLGQVLTAWPAFPLLASC